MFKDLFATFEKYITLLWIVGAAVSLAAYGLIIYFLFYFVHIYNIICDPNVNIRKCKNFFIDNNIPLIYEKFLGRTEVNNMFMKALNIEQSFAGFILYAVINIEKSGINTNFKSWEELYECYCCFMIGYNSETTMLNN